MARRNYSNTAVATTLSADINATASSFTVTGAVTGYPSSNGVLTLDRGQPSEERVLYTTRSGSSFTGVTRGYDGTAAASHSSGSAVEHTITAADLDEPNALVNLPDAKGDLPVASAADTWARLPVGANNLLLMADAAQATGVKWGSIETAQPNTSLGTLGYAQVVSGQAVTSEVDVTGLAVTVTAGTNRRIKITGYCYEISGNNAGDTWVYKINEGAATLQRFTGVVHPGGRSGGVCCMVSITPSAGTHTYKITLGRDSGVGSVSHSASPTGPAFIWVEDLGSS